MTENSYREFIERIILQLKSMTEKKIITRPVTKNNGVQMDAVILQTEGEKIAPTIYLNEYYQQYLTGEELEHIAEQIIWLSEQKMEKDFDTRQFLDFAQAKQHILFKIVHAKRNEELLKEIPYKPFLDLAVVFYYFVPEEGVNASILIRNEHKNLWGVTDDELYELAIQNTPKELESEIQDLNAVVAEIFAGMPELEEEGIADDSAPMYVVTNKKKYFGAVCMLYPGLLKTFAEMQDCDFYILPSSIHELLLVPTGMADAEGLTTMVREVNETQVAEEELLSDHVYLYKREKDEILDV